MAFNNQSILLKARYLEEEHEELEAFFLSNYGDFFKAVEEKSDIDYSYKEGSDGECEDQDDKSEAQEGQSLEEDSSEPNRNFLKEKGLKPLFSRIVTISHPDKHEEHLTTSEKESLVKVYQKCIKAAREESLFGILSCAKSLYLDVPALSQEDTESIKNECKVLQDKIESIKNTYVMLWAKSDNKEMVVDQYIKSRSQ